MWCRKALKRALFGVCAAAGGAEPADGGQAVAEGDLADAVRCSLRACEGRISG